MAWSEAARRAALEARRRRRAHKKTDLSMLKPKTRELLEQSRTRLNKYWVGKNATLSRTGMAKDLKRGRKWKREKAKPKLTAYEQYLRRPGAEYT